MCRLSNQSNKNRHTGHNDSKLPILNPESRLVFGIEMKLMEHLELTTSSTGGKGHVVTQSYEKAIKPLMEQMTLREPLEAGDELLMCFFVTLLQGSYSFFL